MSHNASEKDSERLPSMYVTGMSLRKERKKGKFGYSSESEEEKEDEQKPDEQKADEQKVDEQSAD